MLILFNLFAKLITALNSEDNPNQLAAGFAFGAWIGLMPIAGLIPTIFALLSFLININLGFVALGAAIFKVLAFAIDPIANRIGYFLLAKTPALEPLWTQLYNTPIVPYTRFNNTIVLGSFVLGFLLLVPNYLLGKTFVAMYRTQFREKISQFHIMKVIRASKFYKYYETYQDMRG